MSDEFLGRLRDVLERGIHLVREDVVLRERVRALGELLVAMTAPPAAQETPATVDAPITLDAPAVDAHSVAIPGPAELERAVAAVGASLPPRSVSPVRAGWGPRTDLGTLVNIDAFRAAKPVSIGDLELIAARCRLKAEAARWVAERRRVTDAGEPVTSELEAPGGTLVERARGIDDCYLWMLQTRIVEIADPADLVAAAACFEALADACKLTQRTWVGEDDYAAVVEDAMLLLAEAQLTLRAAVRLIDDRDDPDQQRVFAWLKSVTSENEIYVPRFMRSGDTVQPHTAGDLRARIAALAARADEVQTRQRRRTSLLKTVHYHVQRIKADPGEGHEHDWRRIMVTVERLVGEGLPPSSKELREVLLPVFEILPDFEEVPTGFERAICEIERYQESRRSVTAAVAPQPLTREVAQVAAALRGRTVVLIGGDPRSYAKRALEEAFGLEELIWIETRETQTRIDFDSELGRPDVAVILLLIRWIRHAFNDVKALADEFGKPLVRLPAGYHPNQVAVQVLRQVSEQLGLAR